MNNTVTNYHPYIHTSFGLDVKKTHIKLLSCIISCGEKRAGIHAFGNCTPVARSHLCCVNKRYLNVLYLHQYHPPSWTKFWSGKCMQSHCFHHAVLKSKKAVIFQTHRGKQKLKTRFQLPRTALVQLQCPSLQGWQGQRNPTTKPMDSENNILDHSHMSFLLTSMIFFHL